MPKPKNPNRVPALKAAGPLEAELGAIFRLRRKTACVTLAQLAAELSCSINTIRFHEAGERIMRADQIVRAAGIFGCQHSELMPPESVTAP